MNRTDRLYRLMRGLTALTVIMTALAFIGECLRIYLAAENPMYTVGNISAGLKRCFPVMLLCLLCAFAAGLLQKKAAKAPEAAKMGAQNRLRLMKKTVSELSLEARALEKRRRMIKWTGAGAMLLCLLYPALYLGDRAHFESWQLNNMFLATMLHTLPGAVAALLLFYAREALLDRYALKEIELLKAAPRGNAPESAPKEQGRGLAAARAAILLLALALIVWGVFNGSMDDVLKKAIAICTECIGLG